MLRTSTESQWTEDSSLQNYLPTRGLRPYSNALEGDLEVLAVYLPVTALQSRQY